MNLNEKKKNFLSIIETLDSIFVLPDTTKKEIFEKMISLNEDEINKLTQTLIDFIKKQKEQNKENLMKVKTKKIAVDELIDDKKDGKYDDLVLNNI